MPIEVQQGVDHHGWYFVRANGHTARSLDELAASLQVPRKELVFVIATRNRKPDRAWLNSPERMIRRGVDFDPF